MKKVRGCEKGASAVEFALLLPILVVLVFGIIEFGPLMYNKQVLTNASREGARARIVQQIPRITVPEIQTVVQNHAADHLVTFASGPIKQVIGSPAKTIVATVICDNVE